MEYPLYKNVSVKKSTSSYGRWVVKVSEVTFKFFWNKNQAQEFANKFNQVNL